jgi:hypothetical protein
MGMFSFDGLSELFERLIGSLETISEELVRIRAVLEDQNEREARATDNHDYGVR